MEIKELSKEDIDFIRKYIWDSVYIKDSISKLEGDSLVLGILAKKHPILTEVIDLFRGGFKKLKANGIDVKKETRSDYLKYDNGIISLRFWVIIDDIKFKIQFDINKRVNSKDLLVWYTKSKSSNDIGISYDMSQIIYTDNKINKCCVDDFNKSIKLLISGKSKAIDQHWNGWELISK